MSHELWGMSHALGKREQFWSLWVELDNALQWATYFFLFFLQNEFSTENHSFGESELSPIPTPLSVVSQLLAVHQSFSPVRREISREFWPKIVPSWTPSTPGTPFIRCWPKLPKTTLLPNQFSGVRNFWTNVNETDRIWNVWNYSKTLWSPPAPEVAGPGPAGPCPAEVCRGHRGPPGPAERATSPMNLNLPHYWVHLCQTTSVAADGMARNASLPFLQTSFNYKWQCGSSVTLATM